MNEKFAKLPIALNVSIPDNVLVPCPIDGKQKRRFASKCCPDCEYFSGIGRLVWDDDEEKQISLEISVKEKRVPWSRIYAIRCNCVMEWICEDIE